jgi:chaperonin cofactor prefoldin
MEDTKGELEELMDQSDQMEMQMKKLKSHLYAKFGTSINLEDD